MAGEIVSSSQSVSLWFYVFLIVLVLIMGVMVFLIRRLNYGIRDILKSASISLSVTFFIQIIILVVAYFLPSPSCQKAVHCYPFWLSLLFLSWITIPLIFIVVFLIYLIVKFFKRK